MKRNYTSDEKRAINTAKYRFDSAVSDLTYVTDSKVVDSLTTEKEMQALKTSLAFLSKMKERFTKIYNEEETYKA